MVPEIPPTSSQPLINMLYGSLMSLLGFLVLVIAYVLDVYRKKVDSLEKDHSTLANLAAAKYVTRDELAAYISQTREDGQHKHEDNLASQGRIKDEISGVRDALREDLRAVHARIDLLRK